MGKRLSEKYPTCSFGEEGETWIVPEERHCIDALLAFLVRRRLMDTETKTFLDIGAVKNTNLAQIARSEGFSRLY